MKLLIRDGDRRAYSSNAIAFSLALALEKEAPERIVQRADPVHAVSRSRNFEETFIEILPVEMANTVPVSPQMLHIWRREKVIDFQVLTLQLMPAFYNHIQSRIPIRKK